jgi:hypothetical protein
MLRYHYQYVTVLAQCDAIVSKKSESVMAGGANDAEYGLLLALQTYIVYTFGRSNKATRYDFDNCDAICSFCNLEWEAR